MNALEFHKFSPGGNPTILITGGDVPAAKRAAVAAELMHPLHLSAEQVGFVDLEGETPRLEMMGGEFCLNAARSMVFLLARMGLLTRVSDEAGNLNELRGLVYSSGQPFALKVRADARGIDPARAAELDCSVLLNCPAPKNVLADIEEGAVLARVPGITHLLLDESRHPLPKGAEAQLREAARWRDVLHLNDEAGTGVVWHRPLPDRQDADARSITPVVYVAEMQNAVLESSCGSASLALAMSLLNGRESLRLKVRQPSGYAIRISLKASTPDADHCLAEAGGPVRLVAEGKTFVGSLDS